MRGELVWALIVALVLWPGGAESVDADVAVQVSKSVFLDKGLSHVVAVLCNDADAVLWERSFAGPDGDVATTRIATPRGRDALEVLRSARTAVGVFLHLACPEARSVLEQSSAAGLFRGTLHWVVAGNASTSRAELVRVAEGLDLAVDSEVTLAVLAANTLTVHLVDAYRVSPAMPLLTQLAGSWRQESGLQHFLTGPTATRRRNLLGVVLRAGVVVDGVRNSDLAGVVGKPKDNDPRVSPVAAFSHMLTKHLQDVYNITLRLQGGPFFGLLERLGRDDLHLITTVLDMQAKYWDVLDYTSAPLWTERSVLILKNPSALWSYDAWTRPLDASVWLVVVLTILSTAAVLRAVGYWEVRMVEGHAAEEDTWPAAITTALSMVCAQGFTNTTNWASGRTMLLVFEFFSLFINLFYSSGIVVFLLTFPPPFAHTVRDVIESPFIVGVDKDVFGVSNFTDSRDELLRELYDKKIAEEAAGGGFLDLREAGVRGRGATFAMVGSPFSMYEMLALSWSQSDICRIQEIQLMPSALLAFATAKRSPFREILNQGILLLVERGLAARERGVWSVQRPRCTLSDVTELDDVGPRQVSSVLGILALGLALALLFLALEVASSKASSSNKWTRRKTKIIDLLKDLTRWGDARKKAA